MITIRNLVQTRSRAVLGLLAAALVAALCLWTIDRIMRTQAIEETGSLARNDAAILSAGLQSELDKFNLVPLVLAEDPEVQRLLRGDSAGQDVMNRRLETLAGQSNAAAIYLMDSRGDALAASNWRLPASFVGSNYRFRQYFQTATNDGSATEFALGTVSRRPGLYIAQRVGPASNPAGIVAVKVEFDALEKSWRDATDGVFVTDREGIVLIASEEAWRFRASDPAALEGRDPSADRQQMGISSLKPLAIRRTGKVGEVVAIPLLDTQQPIALNGWVLHLLVDPAPQVEAAIANGRLLLFAAIALIVALYASWLYLRRRRWIAADAVLAERTRNLREQLTQANRLATLGQVSAGVAHEISQPVAAARVFAETGAKLIEAGQTEAAARNFLKITELTDRIGRITGELRRFSRRQVSEPKAMQVNQALDGALLLLRDRIDSLRIEIVMPDANETEIAVQAEHVRLEQVLVNLLQNAIDATGQGGRIVIDIETGEQSCSIMVSDNGPGIDEAQMEQLFQPFATTKPNGLGLGLVISRDIMRDLGGDLTCTSSAGGAQFTMRIARA